MDNNTNMELRPRQFHNMKDLLSNSKIEDIDYPVIIRNEAANTYHIAENINNLIEELKTEKTRYHSIFLENVPVKLFIDLDDNKNSGLRYGMAEYIAAKIIQLLGIECEFLITKASNKNSFHIHFSGFHFKSIYHMKEWVINELLPNIDEDTHQYIDTQQYRKYGGIRCLYSIKMEAETINKKQPYIYFDHNLEQLEMTDISKLIKMSLPILLDDSDQTEIEWELIRVPRPRIIEEENISRLYEAAEIVCKDNKGLVAGKLTSYNSITLNRILPSMCRVCGREHDRNNSYLQQYKNGAVYLGCYAADKDKKLIKILDAPMAKLTENGYPERDENVKEVRDLINKYYGKKFDASMILQFAADAKNIIGKQSSFSGTTFNKRMGDHNNYVIEIQNTPINASFSWIDIDNKKKTLKQLMEEEVVYRNIEFNRIVNTTKKCGPKDLNLFQGFYASGLKMPPNPEIYVNAINNHILKVWCRNNIELFNFVISWLAKPLQTGDKNGTAIVLYGSQGCGKGIIIDFLKQYVYGYAASLTCANMDPLYSNFNCHLSGKVLIHIEEANSIDKNSKKVFDTLKSLITAETIMISKKFAASFSVDNLMNIIINTNHSRAVYLEESDRRYTVLDCGPAENREYYDELCKIMKNDAAGAAYYNYLMNIKLVNTNRAIMTDMKREIQEEQETYPDIRAFFESLPIEISKREIKGGDLYDMFADYCKNRLRKNKISPSNGKTFITEARRKGFVERDALLRRFGRSVVYLVVVNNDYCRQQNLEEINIM